MNRQIDAPMLPTDPVAIAPRASGYARMGFREGQREAMSLLTRRPVGKEGDAQMSPSTGS